MRPFVQELPLRLTQAQRLAVAEVCSHFRSRLKLDESSQRTVIFRLEELKLIRREVAQALHCEASGRKRNSLRHVLETVEATIPRFFQVGSIPAAERLYQLRISLKGTTPEVWRRIQVKDCTLRRLHDHIQHAMGWEDYHLYLFEIAGTEYSDPDLVEDECDKDVHEVRLSEIVPEGGQRSNFLYLYDFGDHWEHEILFEGCLPADPAKRYPRCLEGARACPPEDVGGVHGFHAFLIAIADPEHEEHETYIEWTSGFNAEEFSAAAVTKMMQRS